jgi:putative transposase
MGTTPEGTEERIAEEEDGVRESAQSWKELLLGLVARGLGQPPEVAIGDGAGFAKRIGFWKALQEV